jgi:hypothetical protein
MRKKLTPTRAKKRAQKLASALAEINTQYADVFKRLSSPRPATFAFEKAADELLKRRAKAYRKLAK